MIFSRNRRLASRVSGSASESRSVDSKSRATKITIPPMIRASARALNDWARDRLLTSVVKTDWRSAPRNPPPPPPCDRSEPNHIGLVAAHQPGGGETGATVSQDLAGQSVKTQGG